MSGKWSKDRMYQNDIMAILYCRQGAWSHIYGSGCGVVSGGASMRAHACLRLNAEPGCYSHAVPSSSRSIKSPQMLSLDQYPVAPGAFSSFLKSSSISLNFSLPVPLAPPLAPFPLRSTSLAMRSQLVPPADVSSRLAKNSSASLRVFAMVFSVFCE